MLHSIGKREESSDLVELLLECHTRIRHFVSLARQVAAARELPADEVIEGCARVTRYFTQALPLHVADEEESLLPRLRGLSPELDAALATMSAQHAEHTPELAAMLEALEVLRTSPDDEARRSALAHSAERLEQAFAEHLELEETLIFPALRDQLSPDARAQIVAELRARRQP